MEETSYPPLTDLQGNPVPPGYVGYILVPEGHPLHAYVNTKQTIHVPEDPEEKARWEESMARYANKKVNPKYYCKIQIQAPDEQPTFNGIKLDTSAPASNYSG